MLRWKISCWKVDPLLHRGVVRKHGNTNSFQGMMEELSPAPDPRKRNRFFKDPQPKETAQALPLGKFNTYTSLNVSKEKLLIDIKRHIPKPWRMQTLLARRNQNNSIYIIQTMAMTPKSVSRCETRLKNWLGKVIFIDLFNNKKGRERNQDHHD